MALGASGLCDEENAEVAVANEQPPAAARRISSAPCACSLRCIEPRAHSPGPPR